MKLNKLKEYKNHKIAILWFWKEGKSSLHFLLNLWFKNITICDKNPKLNKEKKKELQYSIWENYLGNLWEFDLIFKSPWISPYNKKIEPYKSKITSQIQIFTDNYKGKVIWITWTKGKSTTSTLLFLTLQKAWYKVKLVWNIWNPVLEEIDIIKDTYDYIVFEMSSYMLEWLKPNLYIWYLNNIYNCHIDWHLWKENYTNAKLNILKYSENKICNIETKNHTKKIEKTIYFWASTQFLYNEKKFYISNDVILNDENIALKWEHNRINTVWIISILHTISKKTNNLHILIDSLKSCLETFNWLPHRIQNIWTMNWITFIDDAIATTPESTIAAIKTFEHNIWTLMLWWQDSGFVFTDLVKVIEEYKIKNIVLFPDTWETIFWDLSKYDYETTFYLNLSKYKINILKTKSMWQAISFAYKYTSKWKICLLSNAAPSFSLWSWYIQKWIEFQTEVKKQASK